MLIFNVFLINNYIQCWLKQFASVSFYSIFKFYIMSCVFTVEKSSHLVSFCLELGLKKGSVLFVFICLISMLGLLQLFQQIFAIDVNA